MYTTMYLYGKGYLHRDVDMECTVGQDQNMQQWPCNGVQESLAFFHLGLDVLRDTQRQNWWELVYWSKYCTKTPTQSMICFYVGHQDKERSDIFERLTQFYAPWWSAFLKKISARHWLHCIAVYPAGTSVISQEALMLASGLKSSVVVAY